MLLAAAAFISGAAGAGAVAVIVLSVAVFWLSVFLQAATHSVIPITIIDALNKFILAPWFRSDLCGAELPLDRREPDSFSDWIK